MGKETGTSTTDPGTFESATGGRSTVAEPLPVATVSWVGTECWPSATICRSRWSKLTGVDNVYCSHSPGW